MINPPGHVHPFDSTPHLPAAGLGGGGDGESTEVTLKPDIYAPEPACPEHIRKWRKDMAPGKICLHPGVADDALRDDTLFMASRWAAHGIPCELEVYPGAAHGVGHFGPHEHSSQGAQINARVDAYLSAALTRQ